MADLNPLAVYAGFCALVLLIFATAHVVKVTRIVSRLLSAADCPTRDAADTQTGHLCGCYGDDLVSQERCDEEETNDVAADILLWEDEIADDPSIQRYTRRMDRWSQ